MRQQHNTHNWNNWGFSGAVLFIDEAYNLGQGSFGKEACDALVAGMTSEDFRDVLIIIAGYPFEIDETFKTNPGLKSRFSEFFEFPDWQSDDCVSFFEHCLEKENFAPLEDQALDIVRRGFDQLVPLPGFANGRDVKAVWEKAKAYRAKRVFAYPEEHKTIKFNEVKSSVEEMIKSRLPKSRHSTDLSAQHSSIATPSLDGRAPPHRTPSAPTGHSEPKMATKQSEETSRKEQGSTNENITKSIQDGEGENDDASSSGSADHDSNKNDGRDDGVSDEVWNELLLAQQKEKEEELELQMLQEAFELMKQQVEETQRAIEAEELRLKEEMERQAVEERRRLEEEMKRKKEEEQRRRHQAELARRKREKELQRLEEERRRREKIKERLRRISKCPQGFNWIRCGGGWRCAGGSHFVSDAQLHSQFGHDT